MLRVGLTGGIACGKSVVRGLLEARGAFTVDADAIVHELLGAGTEITRRVAEAFGPDVLTASGAVDRVKLGAIVFSNPEARARLNALVHPAVIAEAGRLLDDAERRGERIGVVDAALMIETESFHRYDRLIVVYCPRATQIERLKVRNRFSESEAALRVDAQMPVDEKRRYADFVVDTSGSLEETERQVERIWDRLSRELS